MGYCVVSECRLPRKIVSYLAKILTAHQVYIRQQNSRKSFLSSLILGYRLYRKAKSALQLAESAAKKAYDTVTVVQEFIKPLLPIISLIQGICGGLGGISKIFNKGNNEGGNNDE